MGPDGERSGRPLAGEHGPIRQPGPACVPLDELHAHGVHHGPDRQERQGADQSLAVALQAVAKASGHRHAQPDRPRGRRGSRAGLAREPHAAHLLRHPGRRRARRRSSCSSTAPSSSTRPTSATCSTSSARNCRSATSRSSSTCVRASRPSPAIVFGRAVGTGRRSARCESPRVLAPTCPIKHSRAAISTSARAS